MRAVQSTVFRNPDGRNITIAKGSEATFLLDDGELLNGIVIDIIEIDSKNTTNFLVKKPNGIAQIVSSETIERVLDSPLNIQIGGGLIH